MQKIENVIKKLQNILNNDVIEKNRFEILKKYFKKIEKKKFIYVNFYEKFVIVINKIKKSLRI